MSVATVESLHNMGFSTEFRDVEKSLGPVELYASGSLYPKRDPEFEAYLRRNRNVANVGYGIAVAGALWSLSGQVGALSLTMAIGLTSWLTDLNADVRQKYYDAGDHARAVKGLVSAHRFGFHRVG